jgi:hypothetical protein
VPSAKKLSRTLFQPYSNDPFGIVHYILKQHLQRLLQVVVADKTDRTRLTGAEVYAQLDACIAPRFQTDAFRTHTRYLRDYTEKPCPLPSSHMWYSRIRRYIHLLRPGTYERTAIYLLFTLGAELTRLQIQQASHFPTQGKLLQLSHFTVFLQACMLGPGAEDLKPQP